MQPCFHPIIILTKKNCDLYIIRIKKTCVSRCHIFYFTRMGGVQDFEEEELLLYYAAITTAR